MAECYRLFSEAVKNVIPIEEYWLKQVLNGEEELENVSDVFPDFQWQIQDDQGERILWMYSEDHGDVSDVAVLVHHFLAKFRPKDSFTLCWADTCSRPRISEFSGGYVFVTAQEIKFGDAGDLVNKLRKAFEKKAAVKQKVRKKRNK